MPAIASFNHFKAAQKEGLSFCAMLYAACGLCLEGRTPEQLRWEGEE